jgi:hypothetical protein
MLYLSDLASEYETCEVYAKAKVAINADSSKK